MNKITAKEAIKLRNEFKMKDVYKDILSWVYDMIRQEATKGHNACRLNLQEKRHFFKKDVYHHEWKVNIDKWEFIIDKLSEELKKDGFHFYNKTQDDFHVVFE